MTVELAVQLGLLVFLVGTAVILLLAVRTRKYRQRLATLAQLHGMRRGDQKQNFQASSMASVLAGRARPMKLRDLLVGEDEAGRFYFVRRKLDLYRDQLLCFEASDPTRVSNFRFYPCRRPWSWRRLLGRDKIDMKNCDHTLEWTGKRSRWADAASLGFGARVVGHVARIGGEAGNSPLSVEIHESKILIYSEGQPRGEELNRFFASATQLRRAILNAQRHAHARAAESRSAASWSADRKEDVRVQVLRSS